MDTSKVKLEFIRPDSNQSFEIAFLSLNRPEVSNAFDGETMKLFTNRCTEINRNPNCRIAVLRGEGKNFSAGGDLGWLKKSIELNREDNLKQAQSLGRMFEELYHLKVPTIGVVQGSTFGGGVGLTACCDWVVASQDSRFCLSEVRLGVVAAVILPYVAQKIRAGDLRRFVLSGIVFNAHEAEKTGLVQRVFKTGELGELLRAELDSVLKGSSHAQQIFKQQYARFQHRNTEDWQELLQGMAATIANLSASESGQEGFKAFLSKTKPSWVTSLPSEWKIPYT